MGDGTEGLADVGGVGYVAVGREEDGTESGGVGSVAEVGVCCLGCAGVGLDERWMGNWAKSEEVGCGVPRGDRIGTENK